MSEDVLHWTLLVMIALAGVFFLAMATSAGI